MTTNLPHRREKDKIFRALSEQRRRFALQFLQQHQEATISEMANEIAKREDDRPDGDVLSDAVRIDLYHRHVPILAEAGLVHYEEERDIVTISEHGTNANSFLEGSRF
jgi:DNA-binding transcriptional ArsR family regulator